MPLSPSLHALHTEGALPNRRRWAEGRSSLLSGINLRLLTVPGIPMQIGSSTPRSLTPRIQPEFGRVHPQEPLLRPWNRAAPSSEVLPHVDEGKVPLGAPVVLDVSELRVDRQVFRHLLVRIEMNRIEVRTPGFGFRKLKEGPSEALPAIGGIDSDVVDKQSFNVNGEDYYPHDGSVAFGDGYSLIGDDLCVIVGHRARQHPEALDVVAVGGVN